MSYMEISQLSGNVGEFIGSIGILVTLIYLAVQIRQSGHSTTFAVTQAGREERLAWLKSNRDLPYLAPILAKLGAGETLNDEERYRVGWHLGAVWGLVQITRREDLFQGILRVRRRLDKASGSMKRALMTA